MVEEELADREAFYAEIGVEARWEFILFWWIRCCLTVMQNTPSLINVEGFHSRITESALFVPSLFHYPRNTLDPLVDFARLVV